MSSPTTTASAEHPNAPATVPRLDSRGGQVFRTSMVYAITGIALFLVLAITGVVMRINQAEIINLEPTWFYRLMTLHGAGMFVAVLLGMMGASYYGLSSSVALSRASMVWSYLLILGGGVVAIVATLIGGFAGAWTFLFPLPFVSMGGWEHWSAVTFLVALVLLSLGWGVYFMEVMDRLVTKYGGLLRPLGVRYLFGLDKEAPPAPVVGGLVVALIALIANTVGAAVVLAELVYSADATTMIGMLWAKNLTYSFGHTIMNLLIYMAALMLYTVIPRYAGRPWKATKPFIVAWFGSFVAVLGAYTHHLYLDFPQPMWAHTVGQVASSIAVIPVAVITIYTGILLSWGSKYRWTLASAFMYVGFAGWLTGGAAALLDSLIVVNFKFHNTLWVPGHFHSYLLLGVVMWMIGFLVHLVERRADRPVAPGMSKLIMLMILGGGYVFTMSWYASGTLGAPRRFAVLPKGVETWSMVASIGAIVLVTGVVLCLIQVAALARSAKSQKALAKAGGDNAGTGAAVNAGVAIDPPEADDPSKAIAPFDGMLEGTKGLIFSIVVLIIGVSPPLYAWSETSVAAHHVVHAIQFGSGGFIGLWIGSTLLFGPKLRNMSRATASLGVMLAQAVMMISMAPFFYRIAEKSVALHMPMHVFMIILGGISGLFAARFSRFTAWFVVILGIAMALLWAGGVS